MPKANDKTKRRRVQEIEDGHCSQSQRSGRSNQRIDEEEEEAETESTQIGRSQKSHKELSKDELNRKVSLNCSYASHYYYYCCCYYYCCHHSLLSAHELKFFILFRRAFKMMKIGFCVVVMVLLVAELFRVLIYAN